MPEAQNAEVIAKLADRVAQDINSQLTIINGFADMLLNTEGTAPEAIEPLKQIYLAGEQAA